MEATRARVATVAKWMGTINLYIVAKSFGG